MNIYERGVKMRKKSKQELFWEGNFGDEYISRNEDQKLISVVLILLGIFP